MRPSFYRYAVSIGFLVYLLIFSQNSSGTNVIAKSNAICRTFEPSWTLAERQVWREACDSMFDERADHGAEAREFRQVGSGFIADVLSNRYASVGRGHTLVLSDLKVVGAVTIRHATLPGLTFIDSIYDELSFDDVVIGGGLQIGSSALAAIRFNNCHISGSASFTRLSGQIREANLGRSGMFVSDSIFERDFVADEFNVSTIDFENNKVGQNVSLTNLEGRPGRLRLMGNDIAGGVFFNSLVGFDVDSLGDTIQRNFVFYNSSIRTLSVRSTHISKSFVVNSTAIERPSILNVSAATVAFLDLRTDARLDMSGSEILDDWVLDGGKLDSIDALNLKVGATFRISSGTLWKPKAVLDLRRSALKNIESPRLIRAWPPGLDLRDTTYESFRGVDPQDDETNRHWYKEWLNLGSSFSFSPQPYQQAIDLLKKNGDQPAATELAYELKERERIYSCRTGDDTTCFFLWASRYLTGYGFKLWYAVIWAASLIIVGGFVFSSTPEAKERSMPWGLSYSFDMLLPLIKLRDSNYKIEIAGPARYYFYAHKLAGWVLGTFIVAALATWIRTN